MLGNQMKNEKPYNRRTRYCNEHTWWGKEKMDLHLQNF